MGSIRSIPDELFSYLEWAWSGMRRVARDLESARYVPPTDPVTPAVRDVKPPIRIKRQFARRPVEETDSWSSSLIGLALLFILFIVIMQLMNVPIIVR